MTPLRVIVVGAGEMGRRHMSAVRSAGDRVVAVADVSLPRAREAAAEAGADAYAGLEEALAGVIADVVIVATPSSGHLTQGLMALRAGLDVLVEKPHRLPGEDPAATRAALPGRRYVVGMTTRHWPGVQALAEAAGSGSLGRVLSYTDRIHFRLREGDLPAWYFDASVSGGGVVVTNGVHAVDRARAVLGADLELGDARLARLYADHGCEDSAEIRLHTAEGVPVQLSLLWAPYEPLDAGILLTASAGAGLVRMDGSWCIVNAEGRSEGPPIRADEPFVRQWESFREGRPGFGLDDLEPTLALIERIYAATPRSAS